MEKIKVLHVIRPAEGGMKQHLISLAEKTDKEKFTVKVACMSNSSLFDDLIKAGIDVYPVNIVGELKPKTDWQTIKELVAIMKDYKPDIVHTHSSKAGLVGRIAARMAGVPVILFTAHNSIFYENASRRKKLLYAYTEKALATFTDRIITVSEALKEEIMAWEKVNPDKIIFIPNGIDIDKFRQPVDKKMICNELHLDPDKPIVGTVARFAPQKGLQYLIEAVGQIEHNDAQFVIIGDGPLRPELEEAAKKPGVGDRLIFAGLRRDIERILPVFDIFVLPSVTEGLPLTILEAMASSTPIVATAVGGIPEVVIEHQTGLLVPSGDAAALAKAITILLNDTPLADKVAENGLKLVREQYSLDIMVERINQLHMELIKQKKIK